MVRPPDFSEAVSRVFVPPRGKIWCRGGSLSMTGEGLRNTGEICGLEFDDNEAWEGHARVAHQWMFKSVSYNIGHSGGVSGR